MLKITPENVEFTFTTSQKNPETRIPLKMDPLQFTAEKLAYRKTRTDKFTPL